MDRVEIVATDLDPHGPWPASLPRGPKDSVYGSRFCAETTDGEMRRRFEVKAPYDVALFVGLSSWLPNS